ncbi:MAG: carboxylesterase family protein [Isosphaeraceae bacterium]
MRCHRPSGWAGGRLAAAVALISTAMTCAAARADRVIMKNGLVYVSQGTPDKDNSLVYIWDGLRRVIVRDSKIEKMLPGNEYRTGERFQLIQPIVVHAGAMPKEVLSVEAGPWDERGRRTFRYLGSRANRPISMEQAIIEIGPHIVRYRGIDGFWVGVVETDQVPRPVIMSLIGRVDQKNGEERERVVRFLMDAGWYPEARAELDRLIADFPKSDLSERAAGARTFIIQAEATRRRSEVDQRRKAQQPREVARLLKTFQEKDIATELQLEVRELERNELQRQSADRAMAVDLRRLAARLTPAIRAPWQKPMAEVLKALEEAPDAVRDRLTAWQKAKDDPRATDEQRFALAMSGFVVGHDMAISDLTEAEGLWQARDASRGYLVGPDPSERSGQAARLESIAWPVVPGTPDPVHRLELITRIVQLMPPPNHDPDQPAQKTTRHRVLEDENSVPTEYAVWLPPEYHPLRSYPALVVLHSGPGPAAAIDEWSAEAARHGYILVAPEYNLPGQPHDYRYTTSEHAAVELALRDARKRYSIDSDRVFIAGQLTGGNMAWDYALAHPDLFAGAVVFSGLPAKYVPRYTSHHERVPLYCVLGELAPAANEVIYNNLVKPMILKAWDVTYIEYQRRGLDTFPEEVPRAFDWMDRHHRDPYPKSFKAVAARPSDNRFYGVVVNEFSAGRTTAPEAVELFGQNLNPAEISMSSSSLSNLIKLELKGVRSLDLWLSPKLIDFKRKPEIRVNRRPYPSNRRLTIKLDPESLLDDLRVRGDRQQIYWHRISINYR